ncbi:MAG: hypothetical protein ACRDNS_19630, partial [Trebonia sp.]
VLQAHNYFRGRRGAVEGLWELNMARQEPSLWVEDILGLVHTDAPNRYSRHEGGVALISRFLNDAPDQLWMAETTLAEHGPVLARLAPNYRRRMLEDASREALLAGHRLAGSRHGVEALRAGASPPRILATLVVGLIGPRALATAKVASRRRRARRSGDATAMRRGA